MEEHIFIFISYWIGLGLGYYFGRRHGKILYNKEEK